MAISAGSALLSAVGTGFTATGFVTAGSMFIGGTMLTHFLASTAIGAAINALTPKPTTPGAAGYTVTARGANLDHQIIYGQTRVAGAVVADFLSGEGGSEGTRFLHRVQVMAGHEVESYEEVYVNSYKVTEWKANTSAGGVGAVTGITDLTPWYNDPDAVLVPTKLVEVAPDGTETEVTDIDYSKWNALAMQFWTGADDQTASTRLIGEHPDNKWTSDHRLRGRAYMYIRMGRDADGDNFPTGVPEITAVIKGRKVYDPREVSHDPDDKSTWEWSDNPALCIRDYLTQDFGLGEKDIQVDDDLVETAANVCDQTADDGSTRYTCNGAFTTGIQPYDLLNSILTSMGGLLWYAQGQWRMKPAYWTAPTESFSEDDFRSAISVSTRHSRKDNFNTVEGTFRGPKSNYALTTFPAVDSAASITADGGTVSKIDLEMPFTDTPEEARRIARIVLERNRQQLTVRASFGLKAFRVQVGDVINLSLERFGWVNKTFEVTEWSFGNVDQYDIQIELTLREITENVFDEVDDGVTFELDNANVPSPLAGLAVTNLTATPSGFLGSDGTFIGNILVEWDAIVNSNVAEYVIEWGRAAFNFDDYGGEVTSVSADPRETFIFNGYNSILGRNPDQGGFDFYNTGGGSGLTQTQFEAQLTNSPEARAISGSARVDGATTEFTIPSAVDDSMYSIRVKAINDYGTSSAWATVTVNTGKDDTSPNAPTSLTATGGYRTVRLAWTAPTTNTNGSELTDLALYNIYRGLSANPTTKVASTAGEGWTDSGLADNTTYHYRVTAVDFTGNESAYSNNASTATNATLVDGTDGNTVAVVNVYIRSATAPSTPTGGSFNFDTLSLTPPSGWSTAVPAGTDPVYVSVATASITGTSGTDSALTWSTPSVLAQNGDDGTTGKSVYTATVFQRSATTPSAPRGGSFNFGTNVLTPPSGWYLDIPAGTDPSYGTRFVFSITGDTGSQTAGTWSTPFKVAEDGQPGADGISTYQASIFRRSSSTPSTPTGGSYNFGTNTLTPPSGWSISVPSGTDPLYTSTTLASIQGVTGTDSSLTWVPPTILAQDGADGVDGIDGADGNTVALVNIYIRATSTPSTPTGGSFNFDTVTLTPPTGWATSVPTGTDPIYTSVATASIVGTSGTDSSLTWAAPNLLAQNGQDGAAGKSVYTAIVFLRSASTPSAPSGGSFNFGTNTLTPPSGWFLDVPSGTDPAYGTRFVFSIVGDTGSQTAGTWSTPFKIAEDGIDGLDGLDGADGLSTYLASIFRRSSSTPSTPTGGSYNFGTNTLTPPSGWSISVPSGTDPLYTSTTLASIQGVTGTDSSLTWTTPVILARDGVDGDTGDRGPGRWYIDIDATAYNLPIAETTADNAWNATTSQHPTRPVVLDQVIFYEGTQSNPTRQQAFICTSVSSDTSHTWNEQEELIDGDLLVTGTITGDKIAGSTVTADKLNVTNLADLTSTYQNDSTVSGLTVGTLISAANNGMRSYRYSNTSTGYAFAARNYVGPAGQFQANIANSTGSYDAIVAENGGGSGSTAVDARSTRTGGGHAQIALTVNDGGYGIFLPATSADGGLDASGGGWSPFTGVHMGMLLKTCTCVPGDIVTDHFIAVKTVSDTFGEVRASTSPIQAGAIGVLQKRKGSWILPPAFIDKEATRLAQESAPEGVVVDPVLLFDPSSYHEDYDLVDINSVGEGGINVCGEGGNISKGDLIVTSSTPGKGMKQADDIVRSYTVAKAREDVTFSGPDDIKMIACIYLCG